MNATPQSPKAPLKQKKRFAKKSPKNNGSKARAASSRREAKAKKSRGGTVTALDYCEMMHRIFMEQQNDPNPLRNFITVEQMADMFELDRATIHRYLAFMRLRLHLPVQGIRERGGQGYTEKVFSFPLHTVTQGDMFLLTIAKGALGKGTPFADKFPPLCAKFEKALKKEDVDLNKLESIVHFHDAGLDARVLADPQLWDFLAGAIMDRREISFQHLKAEPGATPTHRVINPVSLHEIGRAWYVWCPDDDRPGHFKKFALSRMAHVERTGGTFERIQFDPVTYLNSIGAFTGGAAVDVHLRALGKTAILVKERPIHSTQKFTERADGSIDIHLRVACTPELEDWVNQRAGTIEVVAPAALREKIRTLLSAGAELNR
jgi:predicted DNA-binding transcriptional regulator YafY